MKEAILVIDKMPNSCDECEVRCDGYTAKEYSEKAIKRPTWCPLKPLNKVVKAGDRNLIIYERAWLYLHLEEEFELQKKVRDWEIKNEIHRCRFAEVKTIKGTVSDRKGIVQRYR